MTERILTMEGKVKDFIRSYYKYLLGGFGIGLLTYFMMMSLNLVNDIDGIWHPSNFIAGNWEISLGRGLQRYADRARFGIVSDSFNSMITLFLITVANVLILKKFNFKSGTYKILFLAVAVANPVICNTLSYSYMSVNFGLAYLFSVAAFVCTKETMENWKKVVAVIIGGASFLAISMAFYQAYICLTSILVFMYTIKLLIEKENTKKIFKYLGSALGMFLLGGGLYLLITKALLYRAGIQMASYKGASGISVLSMLKNLPASIKQCYVQFVDYVFVKKASSNLEFINAVLISLLAIYAAAVVIQFFRLFKHNKVSAFLFLTLVILLPVAACSILLIAVGNAMTGLMSMGIVMCIVLMGTMVPDNNKTDFWLSRAYLIGLAAFAWFQLSAVTNDQLALKEGKTATITLTENIVSRLYDEGYLEENQTVAFIGRPAENDRFVKSRAYHMSNSYAKFGSWSTDARNNRVSWEGVISNFLGVNLSLCGDAEYLELTAMKQVADMPQFPKEGSICVINDTVVVKVSDLY